MFEDDYEVAALLERTALGLPDGAWTREYYAANKLGEDVEWDDPLAVRWCVVGRLESLDGAYVMPAIQELDHYLREVGADAASGVTDWNDHQAKDAAEVRTVLFATAAGIRRRIAQARTSRV